MEPKETIVKAMKDAKRPLSQKEVEELTGLDAKVVDKAFKELRRKKRSYPLSAANGNQNNIIFTSLSIVTSVNIRQ